MPMLREVRKTLIVDGVEVKAGSVVDVSGWKNVAVLERSRYLAPIPEAAPKVAKPKTTKARVSEPTDSL